MMWKCLPALPTLQVMQKVPLAVPSRLPVQTAGFSRHYLNSGNELIARMNPARGWKRASVT